MTVQRLGRKVGGTGRAARFQDTTRSTKKRPWGAADVAISLFQLRKVQPLGQISDSVDQEVGG